MLWGCFTALLKWAGQRFSSFHGLWLPFKDSQHLWPLLIFFNITAALFSNGLCLWPPENFSVVPRGLKAAV